MYMRENYGTNYEGLNKEEVKELLKRKSLQDWVSN
jgi:hypothetical protein